jgi:hypothetical protein
LIKKSGFASALLWFISLIFLPVALAMDFYGVQLRSEAVADKVTIEPSIDGLTVSGDPEHINKDVYGYGFLAYNGLFSSRPTIVVRIYNTTRRRVPTGQTFVDYTIVTRDGARYELGEPTLLFPANEFIPPKKSIQIQFTAPYHSLKREDIKMIICSFELGERKVILLPIPESLRMNLKIPKSSGFWPKISMPGLNWPFFPGKGSPKPSDLAGSGVPAPTSVSEKPSAASSHKIPTITTKDKRFSPPGNNFADRGPRN